jgi:lambda family phage minor tail protein L
MPKLNVYQEAYSFAPSSLIELFKVDGINIGLPTIYYFCNGTNTNFQPIIYAGINYIPFPVAMDGAEIDGKNSLPRPKLTLSNINGFVSSLLLENNQLVGALVTRTRVFARFLDASNFSMLPNWVTPDPSASYEPEVFYVNRKITENQQIVSFELASVLDVQNVKLPRRQILANTCQWKFRGTQCGWNQEAIADAANKRFDTGYGFGLLTGRGLFDIAETYDQGDFVSYYSTIPQFAGIPIYYVCTTDGTTGIAPPGNSSRWIADACSKTMSGCKLRYDGNFSESRRVLRTSAFPGVARAPFISRA